MVTGRLESEGPEGNEPPRVDVTEAGRDVERLPSTGRLRLPRGDLGGGHAIDFEADSRLLLRRRGRPSARGPGAGRT